MSHSTSLPNLATLIEIDVAGERQLAVIIGEKKGRAEVLTETGQVLQISAAKIVRKTAFEQDITVAHDELVEHLLSLRLGVEKAHQKIDLACLWELLSTDAAEGLSLTDVAELLFETSDEATFLATDAALKADTIFFRYKNGLAIPRPNDDVQQAQARREAADRQHAEREDFITCVLRVLEDQAELPQNGVGAALRGRPGSLNRGADDCIQKTTVSQTTSTLADAFSSVPHLRRHAELLIDFAAMGEPFARAAEAKNLLATLNQRSSGVGIRQTAAGAVNLLHSLGVIKGHESLLLRKNEIRTAFDVAVSRRADELTRQAVAENTHTVDLTHHTVISIDAEETRDIDDALHVIQKPDGQIEVGIHVTAAASLLGPDDVIDAEARKRASSCYLPTQVVPMLPTSLSEGRLSLVKGQPRQSLSVLVAMDANGTIVSHRIVLGLVEVKHRLSYRLADEILEDSAHKLHGPLAMLARVAECQYDRRQQDGATDIALPQVQVRVDGDEILVSQEPRSQSRFFVSELMVLAGQLAAEFCIANEIPALFRAQELVSDDEYRLQIEGIEEPLVRRLAKVRLMRRATLRAKPFRHEGLGLDAYLQVTSPLRRYSDLFVHYQLHARLLGQPLPFDQERTNELAPAIEQSTQRCMAAQRQSARYWLLEHLRRTGEGPYRAVVLFHDNQSKHRKVPVILVDTMVRAKVAAAGLTAGQHIDVILRRVDPEKDQVWAELVT